MTLTAAQLAQIAARDAALRVAGDLLQGDTFTRAELLAAAIGRYRGVKSPRAPICQLLHEAKRK